MSESRMQAALMLCEIPIIVLECDRSLTERHAGYHLICVPRMSEAAYQCFLDQLEKFRPTIVQESPSDNEIERETRGTNSGV